MRTAAEASAPSPHGEAKSVTNRLGMWVFLATEILFFGGLFVAYIVFRWTYPASFEVGGRTMEFWLGTVNTVLLLTSSLFMAIGDRAARSNDRGLLVICLCATALLGLAFLGIKAFEYHSKAVERLVPGSAFRSPGKCGPQLELFMFLYFAMTGLHAAHMVAGLFAVGWLLYLAARRGLASEHSEPVAIVGLYWHFIDCIWIFLYPLFYLPGR